MRCMHLSMLAWLAVGLAGCGATESPEPATGKASETVYRFLEAVRLGKDAEANKLLTTLARQKTEELDMALGPAGSDTASFHVGKEQHASADSATVESSWTDLDREGVSRTDQVTWILKREGERWRIAGMSAQVFPDMEPIVLDFENPVEMIRQQQLAEEEAIRRSKNRLQQAQAPAQGIRR